MLTEILYLNLVIAGILILSGFYFKEKALYLSLSGSILLIVTGIVFYSQGVDIVSGATETIANNITEIVNNRTTIKDDTTYISGFVILLLGFAGMVGSALALYSDKQDRLNKEEEFRYYEE